MSFLNSVLSSIETGNPSSLPTPRTPATSKPATASVATASKSDSAKPTPPSIAPQRSVNNLPTGTKRKAEDSVRRPDKPAVNASKARPKIAPIRPTPAKPAPATAAPCKPPPKGSFADLMAKAKAVQKEAPKIGVLKHQSALPKEKISKSEKKRRVEEAAAKEKEAARLGKKSGLGAGSAAAKTAAKSAVKPGVEASTKRQEVEEPGYKGTSRPPQPAYKGTAGRAPRQGGRDRHRAPPRDEYLGTDEEDAGDYYNDYDDYYSDESSDMEAGLGDMEREEFAALRAAEKEDAEDMRQEAEAKKAKLERKQKLTALARARR
ncbi:uncharacterized protein TRUGW13939_01103 [Talaromyces rugulosus]|uniref:SPT2 chromatin protein n=1 Tax=Talaromyces rugulosus TaxID=121627 RepID=A0A7H8QKH0_TALRU|nr:uncharacterized protein TRUGW13939_01103 [Talaromyces rugulosus]QKX54021.1 hypothetical protein TRUGW13939_01103 [Talaromyces rugulosus]